jgi:hypothetical protein
VTQKTTYSASSLADIPWWRPMSNILDVMEKNGWWFCERWLDFDREKKPIVRFVKHLAPLPAEVADRIAEDPTESEPARLFLAAHRDEAPGLTLVSTRVLDERPPSQVSDSDSRLAKLCEETVPVYVNLSVTDEELEDLLKARKASLQRVWQNLGNSSSPAPKLSAGGPTPPSPSTDLPGRPLSLMEREKLNRKLMEANIKEDLKNKLRDDTIWGVGIMPGF